MNHRERFLTALKLGEPDRVPIFDLGFNEKSIINVGKFFTSDLPPMKHFIDCTPDEIRKFFEVQFQFARVLDLDAMSLLASTGNRRIPGAQDLLQDRYGIVYRLTEHGSAFPVDGPVKEPADLKKFKPMMPTSSDFRAVRYMREKLPDRFIILNTPGTFRFSWSLLGAMEKLLFYYVTNPDFCLELARITTDFVKALVEASIDAGADGIVLEGDLAMKTNTLMSPAHYRKFLKPYHQEICAAAHKRGVPIVKHTDGNIWPILDDLLEAGFDGVHPVQPQSMEIKEVKDHLKGKACVLGNIDCAYLLPFGKEEEVIEAVKETIRKAAPGGGYILSSSNSIHPGCKGENVIAMFEAARKYGAYPLRV